MIVVFRALSKADVLNIVENELAPVRKQLKEQQIELEITQEAKELLVDKGYDPDMGARPLRRVIQNLIQDELAEHLLKGMLKNGGRVMVTRDGDQIKIESLAPAEPELAAPPAEPEL